VDELRRETQDWLIQLANHADTQTGARGVPTFQAAPNLNGLPLQNVKDAVRPQDATTKAQSLTLGMNPVQRRTGFDARDFGIFNLPAGETPSDAINLAQLREAVRNLAFADPTAVIGLTVVPGSALTVMRSDAAPPLSQAIVPTWSGQHTFQVNPLITNAAPGLVFTDTTAAAKSLTIKLDANIVDLRESAGASGSLLVLDLANSRVGIGTNAPGVDLDMASTTAEMLARLSTTLTTGRASLILQGASGTEAFVVRQNGSATANTNLLTVPSSASLNAGASDAGGMLLSCSAAAPILFATGGTAFANERGRFDATGLTVTGAAAITGALTTTSVDTGNGAVELYQSGSYTPGLTNVTNLTASTAHPCQYQRVGNVMLVSGVVDADPTAAGLVQLGINLPVGSNFTLTSDCGGVAFCGQVAGFGGAIAADAANDRAELSWIAVDVINRSLFFIFMYTIQ
jgi:hypothetical protein